MPLVLLHNSASFGACFSTSAQSFRLKARFSGPDSWIMVVEWRASSRLAATLIWEMEGKVEWSGKKVGRVEWMWFARSGRVS